MLSEDYRENYHTGWIKIFRSVRDHWIWKDPVKFKWWIDILLEVNHSKKTVAIGYNLFDCERGECIMSLKNWSERWNVSKTVVNNFLKMLEKDSMILIKSETVTTRITVCNYDTYQQSENGNKTQQKRNRNATETQQSTTKELKNDNNEKKYIYSKFYDSEIKNADENYKLFVSYLFGKNSLNKKLSGVLSIEEQLTVEQFNKIYSKCKTNKLKFGDILTGIENDKKYYKGKKSLYRTMLTWVNR